MGEGACMSKDTNLFERLITLKNRVECINSRLRNAHSYVTGTENDKNEEKGFQVSGLLSATSCLEVVIKETETIADSLLSAMM